MESTTRAKPRILYKGAPTQQDLHTLKDVGELLIHQDTPELEPGEVFWVDCATTKPEQYGPLLKVALDAGKTLVMNHLDAQARELLSRLVDTRLEASAETLVVSQIPTPARYALTILGAEAAPVRRDWSALLEGHLDRNIISMGGFGLLPPPGVMYGIRTLSGNSPPRPELPIPIPLIIPGQWFTSSFYVYRENGGANTDYMVIRVQQATFVTGSTFFTSVEFKGPWQFELNIECSHDRQNVPLLDSGPATTSGSSISTHISIPIHVKYLRDGSCTPQYWSAVHGPVTRLSEEWGVSNQSHVASGKVAWRHVMLSPWNSIDDPLTQYDRWWRDRYDLSKSPPRVKPLNQLGRFAFTVENVAAWRFAASTIASSPEVTFTEKLAHRLAVFRVDGSTSSPNHSHESIDSPPLSKSITLNLPQITEDIPSPCR